MAVRTLHTALNDGSRIKTGSRKFGAGGSLFVPNATSGALLVLRNSDTSPGSTWTVEAFCRVTTFNANENVLFAPSSTGTSCVITLTSTSVKVYDQTGAAAKVLRLTASATLATLTYYHVAVTYNGTTLDVYLDGVNIGTVNTTSANLTIASGAHFIGRGNAINTDSFFGNIDEFRFSSIRRYTSGFTPTAVPFTDDADTKMLFHFDNSDQATSVIDDDGTDLATRTRYGAGFNTTLTQTGTFATTSTTLYKKYGTKSYNFPAGTPGTNNNRVRLVATFSNDLQGQNGSLQPFIVEFWFRQIRINAASTGIFGAGTDGEGTNSFSYSNGNDAYVFNIGGTTRIATGENNQTNFNHVAIEFKPNVGTQCYYNGVKVGAVVVNTSFSIAGWYIGSLEGVTSTYSAGSEIYIDDFRVTKGLQRYNHTAFTPPASLLNDEYTILLLKAEETTAFVDVFAPIVTHSAAATLSSAFTSTQAGAVTKFGAVNVTSQFGLEAQAQNLIRGASLEFGQFALIANAGILHKASANLDVYFGYLFDDFDITRNGSAAVASEFAVSAVARIVKLAQATLSTQSQMTTVAKLTQGGKANTTAQFALTALSQRILTAQAVLNSQFGQSAAAISFISAQSSLFSQFALQANYAGERSDNFIVVPQETNQFDVAYETRNIYVTNELRKMLVNKESRAQLVASETRTYTVY